VEKFTDRVAVVADRLDDNGFILAYHNGAEEFSEDGEAAAFEAFLDGLNGRVPLELDVGLATYAGADPVELIRTHNHRTPVIHVTDTVPETESTEQVELGAGEVDAEQVVDLAESVDVDWLVYDYGVTSDPTDSLIHGATKLAALLDKSLISSFSP